MPAEPRYTARDGWPAHPFIESEFGDACQTCGVNYPIHNDDAFRAYIDYQEAELRAALNPMLLPQIGRGYVPTPAEAYRKRLRDLGYGDIT